MCKESVDELTVVTVNGKSKKVCDDCAEVLEEKAAVAEESESAVQNMMGFKGRR
jgi:ribosome-binding protein aMBF1 (putative translation factor)